MNTRTVCGVFFAASAMFADTTFTYQNGVNGYAGGKDISINTQYAQYNGGNGTLWKGAPELGCYTTTGTGAYTARYLLKFGGLTIPAGSKVASATLAITLDAWINGPGNLTGFYLKNSWNADSNNLGWLHRDDSSNWAGPGASSAGADTIAAKSFQVPALKPVGTQTLTIPLDTSVVQSWLDSPAADQGIMLVNNNPGDIVRPVSTVGTQAMRPKLTIVISGGAPVQVTVSPTNVTLRPGGVQTFTATVTGSTNTAVTWKATGGTISASGTYTAGSTPGSFSVTATSAADSTKSATATVTVQSVGVSISPTSATLQPGQVQQFSATVTGTNDNRVTWSATGGTISTSGLYTAGQNAGNFSVTAQSVADSSKGATVPIQIVNSQTAPVVPRQVDGPNVVIQSPVSGMHFTAPAMVRIYADPYDGSAADPDTLTVNFLLNGQSAGTFTGSDAQNGYFALSVNNLAAGTYVITAQITSQGRAVTSAPVTIFVDNPQSSPAATFNLTSDVVLSGSQTATYAGTSDHRCLINGNGFQIRSAAGFTGVLTISNCDIRGLGTATNPGINVTVNGSGAVQLTGNTFDTFGTISIGANDQALAVVRNNEFRENTLVPVGSQPEDVSSVTLPVFYAIGNSTAQQFFQGNNVGLSTVVFENARNWLIGGSTDAQSNILMGVRCGFRITGSTNMVLRGNYSQHNYPHRFSQGENFELSGDGFLVEHNIIRNSSWPVRGTGGEFRYNLVDESGSSHAAFEAPLSNTNIHHNVFLYSISQVLYGADTVLTLLYNVDNVQFHNNVMDGGGTFMMFYGNPISVSSGSFIGSLRNNVFYNFASPGGAPVLAGALGESTNPPLLRLRYADYNDFFNPDAPNQTNYGLGVIGVSPGAAGYGMHDLGGVNGHVNPKFTQPTALPFPFLPENIWNRNKKVSDVLAAYRSMYAPAAGSLLIGAGDPQDGAGGNIGAVGNGEPADQFGRFGGGAGSLPVIASFTAGSNSVSAGASTTLNWSVTGATSLSIVPSVGNVTGNSVTVTPTATTTYTLTATNAAGSVTATVTITVTSNIAVAVSPSSVSLPPGATRQFTATVTGATNNAVTWSATGGSITTGGLYTAGSTPGSFTVTATSVQDPTRSGSAAVTIAPAQQIGVTVNPPTVTLFASGTQQFTATVTNASNTAVNWTATGGTISPSGLYTAGMVAGTFTATATSVQDPTRSASATITVVNSSPSSGHPRIILDSPTLTTLRTRAQAKTPEWTAVKAVCDSYLGGGTVTFPGGNGYPDLPSVGEGYQGDGYVAALMPLGLCYYSTLLTDPSTAAQYGSKAVAILMAMSDPGHTMVNGQPVWDRDSGYGIRNYGFGMGVGYDWFHDLMSPAQLSQLQTSLNNWISGFENDSFEYDHPQGNYFAGYYAAKCMAALAVQGDSPLGDTWWNDWYNHQHLQRVAPYYAANLGGGGWTEGFTQYGVLGTRNQALPALAVRTAKGIDIIHSASQPYPYPLDMARYLMAFTWPTRDMVDDRGELYNTDDVNIWPGTARLESYHFFAGFLSMWNDPSAPAMHKYARDVKTALDAIDAGVSQEWIDFLFWDETAPETTDYSTLPLSYLAPGVGGVAARSDWSTTATFMTFMSGPYINNPAAGHEAFDKGSLAIERNRNPLLVNADAWLTHEPNGSNGWNVTYNDRYGNWDADHTLGNRILYNTFQVRHLNSQNTVLDNYGEWALQRSDGVRTQIGRYEDGGSYVLALGQFLEDMYRPFQTICQGNSPLSSWSRQIVYLRPSQFVIYDRTGICDSSLDQYLAFHFPANPVEVAAPAPGLHRFDVTNGQFSGSMTVVLPANAATATTNQFSTDSTTWDKVWRTEIRATDAPTTTRRWMTVFDLAPASGQIAAATAINVTGGSAVGVLLSSAPASSAVVSGTAPVGTAIAGPLTYTLPASATRHVITDLTPSGGYAVTVAVSGGSHIVTITPGGNARATPNGVLTFTVTAGGALQP